MTGFDNTWYAEMIERFRPVTSNGGADGVALAILVGFSVLAQAVDGLTAEVAQIALTLKDRPEGA